MSIDDFEEMHDSERNATIASWDQEKDQKQEKILRTGTQPVKKSLKELKAEAPRDYSEFITDIKGKQYMTVAGRIKMFWDTVRDANQESLLRGLEASITTESSFDGTRYQVKAKVCYGGQIATGYASEVIGDGNINQDAALENCETSAIGRALGNFGLGLIAAGGVATAEEVTRVQAKQEYSSRPASQKQQEYLMSLCLEKGVRTTKEEVEAMSASEASKRIQALQNMPTKGRNNYDEFPTVNAEV